MLGLLTMTSLRFRAMNTVIEDIRPLLSYGVVRSFDQFSDDRPRACCTMCGDEQPRERLTVEKIRVVNQPKGRLILRCPACTNRREGL